MIDTLFLAIWTTFSNLLIVEDNERISSISRCF
jgi:hypothetical protein